MRAILTPKFAPRRAQHRRGGRGWANRALVPGLVAAMASAPVACGSGGTGAGDGGRPQVVVTTSLLGDVVRNLVGDQAAVEVLVPPGADPHEASLSARQADEMVRADLVVINGAGFEQSMSSVLEAVEHDGAEVFTVTDHVELVTFAGHHATDDDHAEGGDAATDDHDTEAEPDSGDHSDGGHSDNADAGHSGGGDGDHSDGDHSDGGDAGPAGDHAESEAEEDGGDHGGGDDHDAAGDHGHDHDPDDLDPHFWTDPTRMIAATEALADRLAGLEGLDAAAVEANAAAYVDELRALDAEMAEMLAAVPEDRRALVTNHEVFGYFADRYGFEVVGTVIPAGTTQAEPSSAEVEALADTVAGAGVPAIFVESSSAAALAEGLADSVGDVEVVELFTESLGEEGSGAETYIAMMRTDAERIAGALA